MATPVACRQGAASPRCCPPLTCHAAGPPAAKAVSSKKPKKDGEGAKDMSSLFDALADDGAAGALTQGG